MITATEENILKVLDISKNELSNALISLLEGHEAWIDTDTELSEHIYQFDEALYTIHWGVSGREMQEIAILCDRFECNYFRIITV